MAGKRIDRPPRPLLRTRLPKEARRRVVRETLSTMTEMQRLALSLYHYEKLGPAGIAAARLQLRGIVGGRLPLPAIAWHPLKSRSKEKSSS